MSEYKPPFHMTDKIINLVAAISEQIGRIKVLSHGNLNPHLRKESRIRTIHSSLAIEHNSLSLEQVTAIVDGKHILGNPNEIREVKNAYDTYEMMLSLDPYSVKDLLKAHKRMMEGLIPENGKFRSGGVGVFDGDVVVHVAPPARLVPGKIQDLFDWYKSSEIHPLILSAVFHYEFEFIHPFADGNGRISGKRKSRKRNVVTQYEMLSGHNRMNAAKIAGMTEIPAIVKDDLPDDLAYVYVIETNLMQRSFSDILPSEKAAVLKEQYDKVCGTMKRQEIIKEQEALSGKTSGSGGHNGHQVKSRDIVASEYGFSSRNAARFLRINYLITPFKALIDENRLALLAAVDLSYLSENEQQAVWNLANRQGLKIKPKTAEALRKNQGELTEEKIVEILDAMSVKKRSGNEGVSLKLPASICQKYFSGMAAAQMTEIVEKALEAWFSE